MRVSFTHSLVRALLCLWLIGLVAAAPPKNNKPAKPNDRHGRDVLVIDGAWQTLPAPANGTQPDAWERDIPAGAASAVVPSLFPPAQTSSPAPADTNSVRWYWRRFDIPAEWKKQTLRLRFEAVAENAQVWLNGQKAGEHQGGATPFEFTVTALAQTGASNLLTVRAQGGKWGMGLWQGVLLMAHDEAYLGDCFPQPDAQGHVNASLDLLNTSKNEGDSTLDARIVLPTATIPVAAKADARKDAERVVLKTNQNLHVTPGRNSTTLLMTVGSKQRLLWSPDAPALYLLLLSFRQDKDILDTEQITFGLREWGWKNGAITLNNAPIAFKSLTYPAPLPPVIAGVDDEERLRTALRGLKTKGITLLYVNAPPPVLLRLADEEGLCVVEGARTGQTDAAANEELRGLVTRDRAHACILGWNVRSGDADTLNALRLLDATRFLLAGTGASAKLWPPNQNAPTAEPLPVGLVPTL